MRHAVILAGGRGIRLWPLSRRASPKHVARLFDGQSLLDLAIGRASAVTDPARVWICSNAAIRPQARVDAARFIEEPYSCDTFAAVALSCAVISAADPDATVIILTADHLINPVDRFAQLIAIGCDVAESNDDVLVTFGIEPREADTGYGYIERGAPWPGFEQHAFTVARYIEKPGPEEAARWVAQGTHNWSAGMFAFRAMHFLDLVEQVEPGSRDALSEIGRQWGTDSAAQQALQWYRRVRQTSVDYAIMMPASSGQLKSVSLATVPLDIEWIDVGTFDRLATTRPGDHQGNSTIGPAALGDCQNVITVTGSKDHFVAAIGCENLVIVHTADVTFVCPRHRLDELKEFVEKLDDSRT